MESVKWMGVIESSSKTYFLTKKKDLAWEDTARDFHINESCNSRGLEEHVPRIKEKSCSRKAFCNAVGLSQSPVSTTTDAVIDLFPKVFKSINAPDDDDDDGRYNDKTASSFPIYLAH